MFDCGVRVIVGDQLEDGGYLKETQSFRGLSCVRLDSSSDSYYFGNELALVLNVPESRKLCPPVWKDGCYCPSPQIDDKVAVPVG
jgi:hypothetical protein